MLNSKKQPLWLEFENADGGAPHVVIFKCGDDLRQDALALQVVAVLEAAWSAEALGIEMTPYACVPTSIGAGFVEVVTPALTTASIAHSTRRRRCATGSPCARARSMCRLPTSSPTSRARAVAARR